MSYREGAEIGRSMMGMAQSYATIQRMGNERKRMQWEEEDRPIKKERETAQENRAVARFDWEKTDRAKVAEDEESQRRIYDLANDIIKDQNYDKNRQEGLENPMMPGQKYRTPEQQGYSSEQEYKARVLATQAKVNEYNLSDLGRKDTAGKYKAVFEAGTQVINEANMMMAAGDHIGARKRYLEFGNKYLWKGYTFEDMPDGKIKLIPTREGGGEARIITATTQELQKMADAYVAQPKQWFADMMAGQKERQEFNFTAIVNAEPMFNASGDKQSPWVSYIPKDPNTGLPVGRVYVDARDPNKKVEPSEAELKEFKFTRAQATKAEKKTADEKKSRNDLTKAAIVEYNKAQKAFMENVGPDGKVTATEKDFIEQKGTREEYIADYLTSFGYEKAKQPKRLINPDTKITAQTMAQLDKLPDAEAEKEIRRASPQQRAQIIKLRSGVKETTGKEKVQTTIKSEKQEKAANKPTPEESAKIEARAKELEKEYEIPHEKAVKLATNEVMNLKLPEEVKKAMETVAKWGKSGKVDVRQEMGTGWNK